jgi:hypothetical protein
MDGQQLVLERGSLRVEITPRPFAFTVKRGGRRLLRDAGEPEAPATTGRRAWHHPTARLPPSPARRAARRTPMAHVQRRL